MLMHLSPLQRPLWFFHTDWEMGRGPHSPIFRVFTPFPLHWRSLCGGESWCTVACANIMTSSKSRSDCLGITNHILCSLFFRQWQILWVSCQSLKWPIKHQVQRTVLILLTIISVFQWSKLIKHSFLSHYKPVVFQVLPHKASWVFLEHELNLWYRHLACQYFLSVNIID